MCPVRYSSVCLSRVEGDKHTIYAGVTLFVLSSEKPILSYPRSYSPTFCQTICGYKTGKIMTTTNRQMPIHFLRICFPFCSLPKTTIIVECRRNYSVPEILVQVPNLRKRHAPDPNIENSPPDPESLLSFIREFTHRGSRECFHGIEDTCPYCKVVRTS
jgi:hypothetical protein